MTTRCRAYYRKFTHPCPSDSTYWHLDFVVNLNSIIQKFYVIFMLMKVFEPKDDVKFIILIYIYTLYLIVEFWKHALDYALEQILVCQKRIEDHLTT